MTNRDDAVRDQVLDAAAELFMTRSFAGTTDREIAVNDNMIMTLIMSLPGTRAASVGGDQ